MELPINPLFNIKKVYKKMGNVINPFIFTPPVLYPMEAFIAPANFDAKAQNVNICSIFSSYSNTNKAYGYTFSDSYNTLTLSAATGVSYHYGYTRAGIDYVFDVTSVTNPFTATTDTKRWVIVCDSSSSLSATVPTGAVWVYISKKCYTLSSFQNTYIKYIHAELLTSITVIGFTAFYQCTNLTGNLKIPDSVANIYSEAFTNCYSLIGDINIPSSVTSLYNNSFRNCTGITSITLHEGLLHMYGNSSQGSFYGCTGVIGNVVLPNSLLSMVGSFINCTGITGVNIPSKLASIGDASFQNTSLASINIPTNITSLGEYCFAGITSLRTLNIPNSITMIGGGAFDNCTGLTGTITIPGSVQTINYYAFHQCINITVINVEEGVKYLNTVDLNYDFHGPFASCTGLVTANLPSSLLTLQAAFYNCTNLSAINIRATSPPSTTVRTFYNVNKSTCVLHVPVGYKSAYQAATRWSEFVNIVDDL